MSVSVPVLLLYRSFTLKDMPTRAHHRTRVFSTAAAAGAHGYLATIGALGLLNYTVPTPYAVLEEIAAESYWFWIHAVCSILLLASLRAPYAHPRIRNWYAEVPYAVIACQIGFTMMFCWALFNLLWGLSVERPVSLAGPGLAFIVAAGEQILANAWMRGSHDKGR